MTQRVLVVGAHGDDETLGCGGTLLKHRANGDELGWVVGTTPAKPLYDDTYIDRRKVDLAKVAKAYGMVFVKELGYASASLSNANLGEVIAGCARAMAEFSPDILYVVHRGDVHTDHHVMAEAAWAAAKPLRGKAPRRILAYETLSSTNLASPLAANAFLPQAYSDISSQLDRKIEILKIYETELQPFPAPRSVEAVSALARYRGSSISVAAAETFMVLRDFF